MRSILLFFILMLAACAQPSSPAVDADSLSPEDSAGAYCIREIKDSWVQDWPATVEIDSLTARKARKFLAGFWEENMYISLQQSDTLIDLNGDGYADILIEYYGLSGTGIKNRIEAHLYDKKTGKFVYHEQLSSIINPTFYFFDREVTGYYVSISTGNAERLQWTDDNLTLDTLEQFRLNIKSAGDFTVQLKRTDFTTAKINRWEADIIDLPRNYRYGKYSPLIRRNLSSPE
jgi:hypothetical protein